MIVNEKDTYHKSIYLDHKEYTVTFCNFYHYEITVSGIFTADIMEAEEQARLALTLEGHNESEFDTIKIERL